MTGAPVPAIHYLERAHQHRHDQPLHRDRPGDEAKGPGSVRGRSREQPVAGWRSSPDILAWLESL